jgi:hypothetical protein
MKNKEGRFAAEWQLAGVGTDGHTKKAKYVVHPPKVV